MDAAALRDESVDLALQSRETVFSGRIWDVRRDAAAYGDGEIVREYVVHPGAAAVVAIDEHERVVLIQQYRHPIAARDWEVPAGLLDVVGEPPLEAARRELAEEVDLVAARWDPLVSIHTTPGGSDEVVHLFLARDLSAAPEAFDREAEEADLRVERVPLPDVVAAVLDGRLRNGILATGVLAVAERLRRESQG